tara:strand:+ start:46 stop:699 length:654 start_codon:yes stop_codon:yes gene_type:complete
MIKTKSLHGLYLISPTIMRSDMDYLHNIEIAIKAGVKIFQFRGKYLSMRRKRYLIKKINDICVSNKTNLIINDDLELIKYTDNFGIHIGNDINIKHLRKKFGNKIIIGVSCKDSITSAKKAEQNGASYISFGSFFKSISKKNTKKCNINILRQAKNLLTIPICAIGGINRKNLSKILEYNTDMIALISGIFDTNNIELETKWFLQTIKRYERIKNKI